MAWQGRLIGVLVSMADTLVDSHDPQEFLYSLSESCAELVDATACGVLLMDPGGHVELTAATDLDMHTLEAFEGTAHQGPSFDAYSRGETVTDGDIQAHAGRWPDFVPRALELGYVAALAQPLGWRGQRIGALDVFRDHTTPFDEAHVSILRGLADMAALGICNARAFAESQEQVRNLQQALDSRATVEQAKALLGERLGVSPDEAFHLLRRHARNHNRKLRDVAHRYLHGELPDATLAGEA